MVRNNFIDKIKAYEKRLKNFIFGETIELARDPIFEQMKEKYCKEHSIPKRKFDKLFKEDLEEITLRQQLRNRLKFNFEITGYFDYEESIIDERVNYICENIYKNKSWYSKTPLIGKFLYKKLYIEPSFNRYLDAPVPIPPMHVHSTKRIES